MSKLYSLDEIKSNNGKNGAKTWIVLYDNVYDVTDFLKEVSFFSRTFSILTNILSIK